MENVFPLARNGVSKTSASGANMNVMDFAVWLTGHAKALNSVGKEGLLSVTSLL